MRTKIFTGLFLTVVVCAQGAWCTAVSEENPLPARATPARTQASVPLPVEMKAKLMSKIQDNLYAEKFAPVDAIASQARDEKEKYSDGAWKLYVVYHTLGTPFGRAEATERQWDFHLTKLRRWMERHPSSVTARVAFGSALVSYAWHARGTGYAHTVTDEGWRLFNERMALAEEALTKPGAGRAECPHWYLAMLKIGVGQGWESEEFDEIFEEATEIEPDYFYVYRVKAQYLLPRWRGEPGDWEEFADEVYRRRGAEKGAILYYLIASEIYDFYKDRFFQENKISWPKIKEGFFALEALYGTMPSRLNEVCKMATLAGDRETAKALFDRIGENWDYSVWRSRAKFDEHRDWARHQSKP